jgi:hypothetical protein
MFYKRPANAIQVKSKHLSLDVAHFTILYLLSAAGLDGLSVEHLVNCHPILPCILARLFYLITRAAWLCACTIWFELYCIRFLKDH